MAKKKKGTGDGDQGLPRTPRGNSGYGKMPDYTDSTDYIKWQNRYDKAVREYENQPAGGGYSPTNEEMWKYKKDMRNAQREASGETYGGNYGVSATQVKTGITGPSWWKDVAYQGGGENENLAATTNALLPVFATDQQQSIAKWLGENFGDFKDYATTPATPVSASESPSAARNRLFSKGRAETAISNLESMRKAAGREQADMGPGYKFLMDTLGLLKKYGTSGTDGMSRQAFLNMQKEFDAMTNGIDQTYQELGRALLNPSQGGQPFMQTIRANGRDTFGAPNAKLFA